MIALAGPTGSGKSSLALWLAKQFRAEIVSCDSLQIYRHFDIGTAKLSEAERQEVPHHLLDILDPDETFSAGEYACIGREILSQVAGRGNVPIVVGGTGFYLRALLDGLFPGPQRDELLRARLAQREERRKGSLHRLLRRVDPVAAARIHANDTKKLIRALEVCLLARRPLSELHAKGSAGLEGFSPLLIGLDPLREELYQVLNNRCAQMFESGLLEEVTHLLAMGYSRECKPFESLGYKQALLVLSGIYTKEEAREETQIETRRYAKRQWTWFKKDTRVSWIPGFGHWPETQRNTLKTLLLQDSSLSKYFL
ncbi:MAG TPA: tRNA (adenosine(37)-N6)-dimethylallyltransferase MiaA [Bryobacteraceae bacterium]|nr:tRNA (adenosine(37)-N6)-dimethylallyltransferase MiaA [Bryobacteraceae bacterium]